MLVKLCLPPMLEIISLEFFLKIFLKDISRKKIITVNKEVMVFIIVLVNAFEYKAEC